MFGAAAERPQFFGAWAALFSVWAAGTILAPGIAFKLILLSPLLLVPLVWWTLHRPGTWIAAFFATALLLPPMPFPIGDTGVHACLIFAAFGLLGGGLRMNQWRIVPSAVLGSLVLLLTTMLASVAMAAVNSGPELVGGSFARVGLFGISIYVFLYTSQGPAAETEEWLGVRRLYWIAAVSALFACVDFYYQFPAPAGYEPQFVWLDSGVYRRAQGFFYEASTLGNFCAFFLVLTAVAFTRPRHEVPIGRKGLALAGAVFFAALMLSYSRGSVVNLLVALLLLAWRNRSRFRWRTVVGFAGLFAMVAWQLFPRFAEVWWLRIVASVEYFSSATNGVLSGRLTNWQALAGWAQEHPWQTLLGIGYKTLPYTTYLGAPLVADNMYLSLLIETGIAGLGALLLFHAAILRSTYRASRSSNPRAAFLGTSLFCFWAGEIVQMASGDLLTYWRVLPVYFWVLAMAIRK